MKKDFDSEQVNNKKYLAAVIKSFNETNRVQLKVLKKMKYQKKVFNSLVYQ